MTIRVLPSTKGRGRDGVDAPSAPARPFLSADPGAAARPSSSHPRFTARRPMIGGPSVTIQGDRGFCACLRKITAELRNVFAVLMIAKVVGP